MKILIGASSKLARYIATEFQLKDDQVVSFSREETEIWLQKPNNFCNNEETIIINCAAKTNTKFCEENRIEAVVDNVDLADRVANLCQEKGYKNIYISSEVVFGRNFFNYLPDENCRPHPATWYGATKRMGELITLSRGGMVIRLPILINLDDKLTVLGQLYNNLKSGKKVHASASCYSTPITYAEAALAICEIISKREYDRESVIHVAGAEYMSIYDVFLWVAKEEGLDNSLIGVFEHQPQDKALMLEFGGLKSRVIAPIRSRIKA